ncbi:MAG: carbon starvation protein A [Candidatus Omnitrophota bacterium]|nr:MAG: carbon starvation protein A [Candidatus Omnitrophota bacterium]
MNSLLLVIITLTGYVIAYNTYGKFLGAKIFKLSSKHKCPSVKLRDDKDFVPTRKGVLFGHHFTSIAGLGPIVGPAIAVIWGWVPAVIWVFFGSIFMGAVHDFGALVLSLRGGGKSIGDLASGIINKRVRTLFLLIIFFATWIVIAIFALIIAILFTMYPQSVIPVWFEIPIAVAIGYLIYKKGFSAAKLGIAAVAIMYLTVLIGAYVPVTLPKIFNINPLLLWMIILFIYTYVASTLPVQALLQPRDYINSHQLLIAIGLLILGTIIAHPPIVAPAINTAVSDAPPMLPFIFVVIACGALSGFHSLVSSGTTSKQCRKEGDALFIGYGSMLIEATLAILVIIAIAAGLGMGFTTKGGAILKGTAAFTTHYASWTAASGLASKLNAFVGGASNLIVSLGIPVNIAITILGVFLVSFAATTLDSAARIQRYVVCELADAYKLNFLKRKHPATAVAVGSAMLLAFSNGSGKGAMLLWPLFGSVNQLLGGLTLLVITIYLAKKKVSVLVAAIPMVFMITLTGWAMLFNLGQFYNQNNWLLLGIGIAIFTLEVWMVIESIIVLKRTYSSKGLPQISSDLIPIVE